MTNTIITHLPRTDITNPRKHLVIRLTRKYLDKAHPISTINSSQQSRNYERAEGKHSQPILKRGLRHSSLIRETRYPPRDHPSKAECQGDSLRGSMKRIMNLSSLKDHMVEDLIGMCTQEHPSIHISSQWRIEV